MNEPAITKRRFGCLHVILFVGIAVLLTAVVSVLAVKMVLFPAPFKPVQLNAREEQALRVKLDRLDPRTPAEATPVEAPLSPEPYSEAGLDRTIRLTEKELNALLAKNTDLADKLVIDLSNELVSGSLRIPIDPDVPIFGGKVLRVKTGMSFSHTNGRPTVMFQGVTVMGVPLPNAWLGGMKNVDLVRETGGDAGFWKAFSDGVDTVRVEDGCITIALKE